MVVRTKELLVNFKKMSLYNIWSSTMSRWKESTDLSAFEPVVALTTLTIKHTTSTKHVPATMTKTASM